VNKSFPVEQLRQEVLALARTLEAKSPQAIRYTKEAIRTVRRMAKDQALDYLDVKNDALRFNDKEGGRAKAMSQFLDEKTFKPGLGEFKR
jgi:trans-feruloyl-CoA hydratase/vanillin synthase